ncbi:MAG: serine/threonine protein kinase [Candidatus Hydrogenedens sp.]|nr:serine/threonine protein kinase [Candidatus Hydrogenedens sp.]
MDKRDEKPKDETIIEDSKVPKKIAKYEIIKEIGRGAMGVVYEAYDPSMKRKVAIKTARKDLSVSSSVADEIFTRFIREAVMAGKIQDPNVVTIYDMDNEEGLAYIVMEYIEGDDLKTLLGKKKKWPLEEVLKIANAICSALSVTHQHGIVHRDIKPSNILITKDGKIKLTDFGIAKLPDSTLTQEGTLIGTPHYMSPEQFTGGEIDGRSDQFSLAVVLYELITGEKPFTGEMLNVIMHKVLRTQPLPPSDLNVSIPKALDDVLLKAMSKNPNDRYPDMEAFAKALNECVEKSKPKKPTESSDTEAPTVISVKELSEHEDKEKIIIGTSKKKVLPIVIGIVVVFAIIVVLGVFFANKEGNKQGVVTQPTAQQNIAYFGKVIFNIWQASTKEAYEDYQNYLDLKRISDFITPFDGQVEVEIRNQSSEIIYQNKKYQAGDVIQLKGEPNSISWIIRNGEDVITGELPPSLKPKEAGETVAKHILLPPRKN